MPSHKSCVKRMRISEDERTRNRSFRSRLRQAIKDVRAESNREAAAKKLTMATSIIDRAAGSGLIHKRTAARNKSRLAHFVAKLV
ncbi:MAG: 30S ribosomal protein S20 [candidate division Zixibacteria bacterium]|nr:30S ribosomal protein S20 [candidate division Zixibacteria bacterium]